MTDTAEKLLREVLMHVGLPTVCGDSHITADAYRACSVCGLRARIHDHLSSAPSAGEPVAWYRLEDTIAGRIRVYYETKAWPDLQPLYAAPTESSPETVVVPYSQMPIAELQKVYALVSQAIHFRVAGDPSISVAASPDAPMTAASGMDDGE